MSASDFIPPKTNPLVLALVKALLPITLNAEKLEVRPSENCIQTIKSMRDRPAILAVNHIDRCDPSVVASLSLKCQEDFLYLAARELFDENLGMRGWLMQHSGVYSVIRGTPEDQQSRAKTISIIAQGKQKLVMFPEGDVTGRDDIVLPLKLDGISNLLDAQKLCLESEFKRAVQVIPLAIYYEVTDNAVQPLRDCLSRQEEFLGLSTWSGPIEARVQRILHSMLKHLEYHYGKTSRSSSTDERISEISKFITATCASVAGDKEYDQSTINVFLYSVRGQVQRLIDDHMAKKAGFEHALHKENLKRFEAAIIDLERVQNLLILLSTLQQIPTSIDVLWRIVDRMEQLILGKATAKGNRIAWIEAGQPISLAASMADYYQAPNWVIGQTEEQLRESMNTVLKAIKKHSVPVQINA